MPIIKTLLKATKLEKEKFKIPKSVQDAIPIQRIWPDGIFQVGSRFSKTFFFTDINYSIASKEDKTAMFIDYSELLNALDSGASAKITINNRRIDKAEFEKSLLLPMKEDGLDHYRKEYNEMLLSKVTGTNNSVVQDRYITITVAKKTIDEARTYFARVGTDLITHLSQLSSIGRELDAAARLQIFRDFFKGGEPAAFAFDLKEHMKKGHSFKDWLCPDSMEFQKDHFRLNDRWGRVLYLQGYASYIKDSMIAELCDMDRSLMLSIDILTVPTDEAVREIKLTRTKMAAVNKTHALIVIVSRAFNAVTNIEPIPGIEKTDSTIALPAIINPKLWASIVTKGGSANRLTIKAILRSETPRERAYKTKS